MARRRNQQYTMARGELDPDIVVREDSDIYYAGLLKCRNAIPFPAGFAMIKPGQPFYSRLRQPIQALDLSGATVAMPNGGTAANLTDGDEDTAGLTDAVFAPQVPPRVIATFDLLASTVVVCVDVVGFTASLAGDDDCLKVQYSSDDVVYSDLGSARHIRTLKRTRRFANAPGQTASARYWRVVIEDNSVDLGAISIDEISFCEPGSAGTDVRIIDFVRTDGDEVELIVTDGNCDAFVAGVWQAAIRVPYLAADLTELSWVQSLDTALIHVRPHHPLRIQRQGNNQEWNSDLVPFKNVPLEVYDPPYGNALDEQQIVHLYAFNDNNDELTLTLEGLTTAPVTMNNLDFTATSALLKAALEDLPTVEPGLTVVGSTIQGHPAYTVTFSGGENASRPWLAMEGRNLSKATATVYVERKVRGTEGGEAIFSSARGFPAAGALVGGRYALAGQSGRPDKLIYSQAGNLFELNIEQEGAISPIVDTIDADVELSVCQLFNGRNLSIITTSSAHYLENRTISDEELRAYVQGSETGSVYGAQVVSLQGALVHIAPERDGLYEFVFDDSESDYVSRPISWLSQHLMVDLRDLAHRKWQRVTPGDMVLSPRGDGALLVMTALRAQGTSGFGLLETEGGKYKAANVSRSGKIWLAVERTIDGVTELYLEGWDETAFLDSQIERSYGSPTTTIDGLSHLEGEQVYVWGDGSPQGPFTVSGAQITIDDAVSVALVGKWRAPVIEIMPVRERELTGAPRKKSRIFEAIIQTRNTGSIAVGCNGNTPREIDLINYNKTALDTSIDDGKITGDVRTGQHYGYVYDATCVVTQIRPGPLRVLGIEVNFARAGGS